MTTKTRRGCGENNVLKQIVPQSGTPSPSTAKTKGGKWGEAFPPPPWCWPNNPRKHLLRKLKILHDDPWLHESFIPITYLQDFDLADDAKIRRQRVNPALWHRRMRPLDHQTGALRTPRRRAQWRRRAGERQLNRAGDICTQHPRPCPPAPPMDASSARLSSRSPVPASPLP